jgi:Arc/MetJ family transcription regulator
MRDIARVVIDDDKLVAEAARLGGHRTKREAVEQALEEFILRRKRDRKFYRLLSD